MKGMREALWWKPLPNGKVQCTLCPWNCMLSPGARGICRVRENVDGRLYTLNYGLITALHMDPIEKKPLFHWYPGSPVLSISTMGCNFRCPWCQNWGISQYGPGETYYESSPPEEVVRLAKKYGSPSIAYTYNEPIIWYEYVLDVARLAKREGIKNVLVTNGYINPEPLEELVKYIDAANVDIKVFDSRRYVTKVFGRLEPVLQAIEIMKDHGVHVETTNLIVPKFNDEVELFSKLVDWQLDKLGPDAPLHVTRFYPTYKYTHVPPTPVALIEKFWALAREKGLNYTYMGNVPGHHGEHTYCHECGRLLVRRYGFEILEWNITDDGRCKYCGAKIPIVGERWKGRSMAFMF